MNGFRKEKVKLITLLLGVKYLIDNDKNDLGLEWKEIIESKGMFIAAIRLIGHSKGLKIFLEPKVEEFINSITEEIFVKLIGLLSNGEIKNNLELINSIYLIVSNDRYKYLDFTDENIYEVLLPIIDIPKEATVIDSYSGMLGTYVSIYKHFKDKEWDFSGVKFYAEEIDENIAMLSEFIGYILSGNKLELKVGNSVTTPSFVDNGKLQLFDFSVSAVPFRNDKPIDYRDIYGRFTILNEEKIKYSMSSWIDIENVIARATKKAAILVAGAPLFKSSINDINSRKRLIENDQIECVIKLPMGIQRGTGIQLYWLIINKKKEEKRKNKIQFIDLSNEVAVEKLKVKKLTREGIRKAKEAFENMEESEISFIVENEDVKSNGFNLDMFEYVKKQKLMSEIGSELKKTVTDIAKEVKRGVQITRNRLVESDKDEDKEKEHYLVSLANLVDGKVVLREEDKIVAEDKWVEKYELKEGDVLLTSKGSSIKTAIVDKSIKNAILSANLVLIRVDKSKYDSEFLKYYLDTNIGKKLLGTIMKGSIIMSISNKDLENFVVPDIDIIKQKSIMSMVRIAKEEHEKAIEIANEKFEKVNLAVEKLIFKR